MLKRKWTMHTTPDGANMGGIFPPPSVRPQVLPLMLARQLAVTELSGLQLAQGHLPKLQSQNTSSLLQTL